MKKGAVTALVGSTGSRKTMCYRIVFRLNDVLDGSAKVNGLEILLVTCKLSIIM